MIDHLTHSINILDLNSELANLQSAGGKGANLARLVRFGYRVPDGFIVPIAAYLEFINRNQIQTYISEQLSKLNTADPQNLDDVSETIQRRFLSGEMDQRISDGIKAAYQRIGAGLVGFDHLLMQKTYPTCRLPVSRILISTFLEMNP